MSLSAERFWTNAVAELTIVPLIVLCGSNGASWIKNASLGRCFEAALLMFDRSCVMRMPASDDAPGEFRCPSIVPT